ncbi:YkgJ family cysteine cluster protein [Flavobacterium sp. MMLR14_040]|uniref:YkgJ family cysteine cluster protein n=1 Tax=Flavobacterium sp. MMLR14_040 TaxID=3093843 RepID=UPI00298F4DB2|nr:YkgJ family cysteine cluster protein [Flavobacterium sp. MMLR14_040]MDW8849984.1 YkgJ family cysteine cluster protein [Flavobacterium sp. MMLR14_040]
MAIEEKVKQVEALFDRLEIEITAFKSETHLYCNAGCGKCCSTPNIDASPLEFLPWAFHLFLNGKAEETLAELKNNELKNCHLYRSISILEYQKGSCSNYRYRGLVCRLFGYAANTDKFGKLRMATCKIIKEQQTENFTKAEELINKKMYVPIFSDYYMRLAQIDLRMGVILIPINEALKMAIEEVLSYYAYRPFPDGLGNIA